MSNAPFNNAPFNAATINSMHETMKRLYEAAKELKGITGQSELARAMNASPQTVKNWESRGVSKQGILDAEKEIGCSAIWLETGNGGMLAAAEPLAAYNVRPGPDIQGLVPLISWVQAGAWDHVIDNFSPGDAEDWLPCPRKYGPRIWLQGETVSCRFVLRKGR